MSRTPPSRREARQDAGGDAGGEGVTLFLCGDVMLGRGMDQVMERSVDPVLHERHVKDARRYVEIAEEASGPVPSPVEPGYPWGEALEELRELRPDARIVNLETAVTTHDVPWRGKGIHYRMHPENVASLTTAGVDGCVLANNHVLDWGRAGLEESLETLRSAGLRTAGAGADRRQASRPAVVGRVGPGADAGRILLFAFGSTTAGIPVSWAATEERSGVNLLPDLSEETARRVADGIDRARRPGDLVVLSLHWGGNWGYRVPDRQRRFARRLVEEGGVDLVHGHSSHHPKGLEVHRGRPVLYGCGDLLNDYEGIGGREGYRGELALLYLVTLDRASGRLLRLVMSPMEIHRFRLRRAREEDALWLARRLDRECRKLDVAVELRTDGRLAARW